MIISFQSVTEAVNTNKLKCHCYRRVCSSVLFVWTSIWRFPMFLFTNKKVFLRELVNKLQNTHTLFTRAQSIIHQYWFFSISKFLLSNSKFWISNCRLWSRNQKNGFALHRDFKFCFKWIFSKLFQLNRIDSRGCQHLSNYKKTIELFWKLWNLYTPMRDLLNPLFLTYWPLEGQN